MTIYPEAQLKIGIHFVYIIQSVCLHLILLIQKISQGYHTVQAVTHKPLFLNNCIIDDIIILDSNDFLLRW